VIAKILPFWGSQQLIQRSVDNVSSIGAAVPVDIAYAAALFVVAAYIMHRRAPSFAVPQAR
jgi:hypothetical protein